MGCFSVLFDRKTYVKRSSQSLLHIVYRGSRHRIILFVNNNDYLINLSKRLGSINVYVVSTKTSVNRRDDQSNPQPTTIGPDHDEVDSGRQETYYGLGGSPIRLEHGYHRYRPKILSPSCLQENSTSETWPFSVKTTEDNLSDFQCPVVQTYVSFGYWPRLLRKSDGINKYS